MILPSKIELTLGLYAIVDHEDFIALNKFSWFASPDCRTFYARRCLPMVDGVAGRKTSMHREILGLSFSDDVIVDHINGDGLDNRKCNLRIVTKSQNQYNRRLSKNSSSGLKGVTFEKSRNLWKAHIQTGLGKIKTIGRFKTAEEAHAAYCEEAKKLRGIYAKF